MAARRNEPSEAELLLQRIFHIVLKGNTFCILSAGIVNKKKLTFFTNMQCTKINGMYAKDVSIDGEVLSNIWIYLKLKSSSLRRMKIGVRERGLSERE